MFTANFAKGANEKDEVGKLRNESETGKLVVCRNCRISPHI
jgi:hypothetical protein